MTALSASPTLSSPQEPFPEKEEDALPLPELTMPHTLYCHKTNPLVRIFGLGIANSVGISSKAPQMKLQLNRPLIFFDIEATGLNIASDRIVELCYIKCFPDGTEKVHTQRFNPGKHISEEASKVNGIYDADVAECPTFKSMAGNIAKDFENCDLAGFNSNHFDIPLLVEEFIRAGIDFDISGAKLVDVQGIFHKMEKRDLTAAYKFYCDKDLTDAHTAEADTRATLEVLEAQLDRYADELKNSVTFLAEFSRRNRNVDLAGRIVLNDQGVETINFGKYRGRPVTEVLRRDPGYFGWVMQGDFTQNTKQTFMRIKLNAGI